MGNMVDAQVQSIRYVPAICAATLIGLVMLNLTQAWPKGVFGFLLPLSRLWFISCCLFDFNDKISSTSLDRYQWGSIISRSAMAIALLFLLLLNIGKDQNYMSTDLAHRPEIFNWFEK